MNVVTSCLVAEIRTTAHLVGLVEKEDSRKLARPERFELPTYSSGGCRSIQLSYGRAVKD